MLQAQKICKTCGGKLIQRETQKKASQLEKAYYYTAYYFCPKCQKIYHNDRFKVVSDNQNSLFNISNNLKVGKEAKNGFWTSQKQNNVSGDEFKRSANADSRIFDVEIWTDGACVSNGQKHARAAWAFVSGKTEKADLVPGAKQTNNVAEGLAIFHALDWAAKKNFKKIKIYTDSQITIHNLNKPASKVKVNQEIFRNIEQIISQNKLEVSYEKVLGHSGDINNERADKLANTLAGIQ